MNTLFSILLAQETPDDTNIGKLIFAGVFVLMIIWLILIPRRRLQQSEEKIAWWKNVRLWAIFVASVQVVVYLLWG